MKEAPGGNTNSLMSDMQQKEECVSFIEAGRKVQQNPRDAFSNAWEYLHCLNCKLYFNGLPRSAAQTLCQSILVQHLLKNNIRWVFLCYLAINNTESGPETWSVPELYKEKKKNTTLSFKNSNSTGCTFMNYDFVCTILVTTGGLWLMELIHSIQLGFMFTTYWADKGSQLKQQHKYQHWKIMDLHFPNEKYSIISVKLTLCILSFHQHLYLFRVFISQPLHTRSQLGRRA